MTQPPPAKFSPGNAAFEVDSDRWMMVAKTLVAANYNQHHDIEKTDPLEPEDFYIIWFTKVITNWKAILGTAEIRGLLWVVTFNGLKHDAFIEVYRKVNQAPVRKEQIPS